MATAADWAVRSLFYFYGQLYFLGRDGTFYLMGWTGGYALLALLLAPYLRKFGKFTVPDFIGDRYYSRTARLIAVFCAISISFVYVCGQMQGAGIVFSRFLKSISRGRHYRYGNRFLLRRSRWYEGDYLHSGGTILRTDSPSWCRQYLFPS